MILEKETSYEQIKETFKKASEDELKGILGEATFSLDGSVVDISWLQNGEERNINLSP